MSWVNSHLIRDMEEGGGVGLVDFTCPNRGVDYIWDPAPNNTRLHRVRVGYYFLFGRKDHWPAVPSRSQLGWISTRRIYTIPSLAHYAAIGDVIESGTFNTPDGKAKKNSSVSHTKSGQNLMYGKLSADKVGSEGGNVAYFDGSVRWVKQVDMSLHSASNGGRVAGYWPALPSP